MSGLIRREDAIEVAYQLRHKPNDDEWNDEWLRSLNAIPTVDAVSVARCKECKFSESVITSWSTDGKNNVVERLCKVHKWSVKADDFCSYGERKESE